MLVQRIVDLSLVAPRVSSEAATLLERSGIRFERAEVLSDARGDFTVACGTELTPGLVQALWPERGEAEAIVASRYVRGARGGSAPSRWVSRLSRRVLDLPCFDVTSGIHLYRSSALRRAQAHEVSSPTERLVRLVNAGFKIREIPWSGPVAETARLRHLAALPRWRRLRLSPDAADAEDRIFERASRYRRRKLEERLGTIVGFLEVDVPVLDVGCGSSRLIQSRAKGVGLDHDPAKVRFLRGRARAAVCGELERLPFRDGSFPQLVLAGVPFGNAHVEELERVLAPRGTLVVAAPIAASAEIDERLTKEGFTLDETRRVGSDRILRAVRHTG